jgi:hypothetical protein
MPDRSSQRPKRRRFTVSLRALMLLVLICAPLIGWRVNRAHVQRRAVTAIRKAGALVMYERTSSLEMTRPIPWASSSKETRSHGVHWRITPQSIQRC